MRREVLVFPIKDKTVWLAPHKRGKLQGKLNGYGGGVAHTDRSARAAACREFSEEAGAVTWEGALRYRTTIFVYRGGVPFVAIEVFFAVDWYGDLKESEEMGPPESYPFDQLPYARMMPADADWVPKVLDDDIRFSATIHYSADLTVLEKIEYHDVLGKQRGSSPISAI